MNNLLEPKQDMEMGISSVVNFIFLQFKQTVEGKRVMVITLGMGTEPDLPPCHCNFVVNTI